jgi:hypothetical protein
METPLRHNQCDRDNDDRDESSSLWTCHGRAPPSRRCVSGILGTGCQPTRTWTSARETPWGSQPEEAAGGRDDRGGALRADGAKQGLSSYHLAVKEI